MKPMIPLLMLVACTVPPQAQEEQKIIPVFVVEESSRKEEIEVPKPAPPKPKTEAKTKPEKQKADVICPPAEGETDSQRIIRKLDCLIERD